MVGCRRSMPANETKDKSGRWRTLKREALLDAALVRIAADGIDAFTMEGVAEEAGVAKGTIYLYFDSKRRLVEAAIAYSLDPLVDRVTRIMQSGTEPAVKLSRMAEANLEYFDEHRELFRVHLEGPYFPHTQAGRLHEEGYRTVLGHTIAVLREAIETGVFRAFDPAIAAAIWLESLTAFILRRLREEDRDSISSDVEALLDLFLHGLAGPAGP